MTYLFDHISNLRLSPPKTSSIPSFRWSRGSFRGKFPSFWSDCPSFWCDFPSKRGKFPWNRGNFPSKWWCRGSKRGNVGTFGSIL